MILMINTSVFLCLKMALKWALTKKIRDWGGAGWRGQNRNQREISWMNVSTRNVPRFFFLVVGWILPPAGQEIHFFMFSIKKY